MVSVVAPKKGTANRGLLDALYNFGHLLPQSPGHCLHPGRTNVWRGETGVQGTLRCSTVAGVYIYGRGERRPPRWSWVREVDSKRAKGTKYQRRRKEQGSITKS
jgi:hypothetical protein